nr:uncharacterized protein LOC129266047 [Lytechinus pictus]
MKTNQVEIIHIQFRFLLVQFAFILVQPILSRVFISLDVATPNHPTTVLVEIHLINQHGHIFVDSFPVSFNTKVTDDIQWLLVIPTIAMAILLLILYGYPEVDLLPTSHTSKER